MSSTFGWNGAVSSLKNKEIKISRSSPRHGRDRSCWATWRARGEVPQVNKPEISTQEQIWSSSESPVPRKSARGARGPAGVPIYRLTDTSSTPSAPHFAIHSRQAEIFEVKSGRLKEVLIQVLLFPEECFNVILLNSWLHLKYSLLNFMFSHPKAPEIPQTFGKLLRILV